MAERSQSSRVSGRRFVPVFIGGLCVIAAVALWQRSQNDAQTLPLIAERTLDDQHTLQLLDSNDETFDAYLAMRAPDGTKLWRKGIYRLLDNPMQGITVGPEVITLRAADLRGNFETHAFAREGGRFLWRGGRIKEASPISKPSVQKADHVIEHYGPPANTTLQLSLTNGDVIAR